MNYKEITFDLFEVNNQLVKHGEQPYCLAHCISADFGMFGGIVVGFNERWDMKSRLIKNYGNVLNKFRTCGGFVIPEEVIDSKVTIVYNMITKPVVNSLPTYENLTQSLLLLREDMKNKKLTRLAIPKIGCGIDGLEWNNVSEIIKWVFQNTDIEILVCCR